MFTIFLQKNHKWYCDGLLLVVMSGQKSNLNCEFKL